MIKKIIVISFSVVFIGITTWFYVEYLTADDLPVGSDLPVFTYMDSTGSRTIEKNLKSRIIIVIFSTECMFCKKLLDEINNNITLCVDVKFYLLAKEKDPVEILSRNGFINTSNLLKAANVFFGSIEGKTAKVKFDASAVPAIYLFDINRKLKRKYKGTVDIENIINWN